MVELLTGVGLKILVALGGITAVSGAIATVLPARTVEKWGIGVGKLIEAFLHSKLGSKIGEVIGDKTVASFSRGILKGMGEL